MASPRPSTSHCSSCGKKNYPAAVTRTLRDRTLSRREEALNNYMTNAKKKKAGLCGGAVEDPLVGQMLINIGRMEFDVGRARGIFDRSFTTIKIPFHKDCSSTDMLNKCAECVWGKSAAGDYTYYLADGSGTAIGSSSFIVDQPDGSQQTLPWTLSNYLRVSGIRYPSRLRLYCVRKFECEPVESADSTSEGEGDFSVSQSVSGRQHPSGSPDDSSSSSVHEVEEVAPPGFFEVVFAVPKKSKYRSMHSFRFLTQQEYLAYFGDDEEQKLEYRSVIENNPSPYHLFQINPLEEGCFLQSVTYCKKEICFVKNLDLEIGQAIYRCPNRGSFDVWTGAYTYKDVFLLACIAINDYHGVTLYSWVHNGVPLSTKKAPLLYCVGGGSYVCSAHTDGFSIECTFVVHGSTVKISKESVVHGTITEKPPSHCPDRDTTCIAMKSTVYDDLRTCPELLEALKLSCNTPNALKLLSVVGSGAFGQVHKAIWRGSVVAAKVIVSAGNNKVVNNELNAYKTLHHPNILTFIQVLEEPTRIVILTNFVNGQNLFQLLHEERVEFSLKTKLDISIQISQALLYMHSCTPQVAHLDLKPENVLVEESTFHVYLADFGLGKVLSGGAGRTTMQAGTPAFQPPEQLRGEMVGVGSDIYAMACMIVELFGGKPIWEGMSAHTIIFKVTGGEYPNIQHIPANIAEIVKRCFIPVVHRITASQFLKALLTILDT